MKVCEGSGGKAPRILILALDVDEHQLHALLAILR